MLKFFRKIFKRKSEKKPLGIVDFYKSQHREGSTLKEAFYREEEYRSAIEKAERRTFLRKFKSALTPKFAMDAKGDCSDDANNVYAFQPTFGIPLAQVEWFASWGFIGYQMCALLAQHWIKKSAIKF